MRTLKAYPTQKELKALFNYDHKLGNLTNKVNRGPARIGQLAGAAKVKDDGYRVITINRKQYYAHRLVWIFFNGKIPADYTIDHIREQPTGVTLADFNSKDQNFVGNLQLATMVEQHRKKGATVRTTSGTPGVYLQGGIWRSTIGVSNETIYIGRFRTKAAALEARKLAEVTYWGKQHYNI